MVIVICIIISTFYSSVGNAIGQNEVIVTVLWSNQNIYQGTNVTATIFLIKNNSTEELTIFYTGLHFDWMQTDQFFGLNLANNPVIIPSNSSHTFDPINIIISKDIPIGPHDYSVGIDGLDSQSATFTWDSQILNLVIQSSEKKDAYNDSIIQVSNDINQANIVNYESPKAQSLLEQANNAYDLAISLANQENWREAISSLQITSNYLEKADAEEQKYFKDKSALDQLLIVIGIVGLVLVILVISLVRRKKKSQLLISQPSTSVKSRFFI